tara:strand:- start:955 stop:1386 length:432 start_codon:yes stop_codon:yes gene_type:complete
VSSLLSTDITISTLVVHNTNARNIGYSNSVIIKKDTATVDRYTTIGNAKVLIPFSLKVSSSISKPDKNIRRRNPNTASPEINSDGETKCRTGPTIIPKAISRTIEGTFNLDPTNGSKNAPREITTKEIASKLSINFLVRDVKN